MTPVVAYVRVSTGKQAEEGMSLAAQRKKVQMYAELHGLTLIDVVEDAGRSAKSLRRPGLQRCFRMLDTGKADALLVVKLDRLTRSVRDLCDIVEEKMKGKRLISVNEHVDTQTAAGRLVLNVLAAVSQWEREATVERTTAVISHKRSLGEYIGGQPPYGYRVVPAKMRGSNVVRPAVLEEDPAEQEVISVVDDLKDEDWSLREIADHLNEREFPTRTGKPWSKQAVHRIVKRPTDVQSSAWRVGEDQ